MRPRVFPAEDGDAAARPSSSTASMRPRVFPAEDARSGSCIGVVPALSARFNEAAGIPRGRRSGRARRSVTVTGASMRPRVFPAEDGQLGQLSPGLSASMRPRVFPAEDARAATSAEAQHGRFNEAAGIPRGRRPTRATFRRRPCASMRPRVFPAEDDVDERQRRITKASMRPRVFPAEDERDRLTVGRERGSRLQ